MYLNKMRVDENPPCGWTRMVESDGKKWIPAWAGEPQTDRCDQKWIISAAASTGGDRNNEAEGK